MCPEFFNGARGECIDVGIVGICPGLQNCSHDILVTCNARVCALTIMYCSQTEIAHTNQSSTSILVFGTYHGISKQSLHMYTSHSVEAASYWQIPL